MRIAYVTLNMTASIFRKTVHPNFYHPVTSMLAHLPIPLLTQSLPVCGLSKPGAFFACPVPISANQGIRWIELMAMNAVGSIFPVLDHWLRTAYAATTTPLVVNICSRPVVRMALRAVGFFGVIRRRTFTSKNVLLMGDRFEVGRIHARPIPAEVIQNKAFGDTSVRNEIRSAVRHNDPLARPPRPVSSIGRCCGPFPAIRRA